MQVQLVLSDAPKINNVHKCLLSLPRSFGRFGQSQAGGTSFVVLFAFVCPPGLLVAAPPFPFAWPERQLPASRRAAFHRARCRNAPRGGTLPTHRSTRAPRRPTLAQLLRPTRNTSGASRWVESTHCQHTRAQPRGCLAGVTGILAPPLPPPRSVGRSQMALVAPNWAYLPRLEYALLARSSRETLLWLAPSEAPLASQASECSELLDWTRAICWVTSQH